MVPVKAYRVCLRRQRWRTCSKRRLHYGSLCSFLRGPETDSSRQSQLIHWMAGSCDQYGALAKAGDDGAARVHKIGSAAPENLAAAFQGFAVQRQSGRLLLPLQPSPSLSKFLKALPASVGGRARRHREAGHGTSSCSKNQPGLRFRERYLSGTPCALCIVIAAVVLLLPRGARSSWTASGLANETVPLVMYGKSFLQPQRSWRSPGAAWRPQREAAI
mmetsp:Transcript_6672/g.11751  ORF Transcript_6672/g.11751 Transcript_6672/m.11751 type:complete len:218 (+) Transcript_6672:1300-1953(+)